MLERELRPRFVTVIAAVYDRRTTRLTYAKAGHAPPIVFGAAHDPDAETPACPIGVGVGESWPEFHVDLADGVSVCLVTDGLEDASRDGDAARPRRGRAARSPPTAGPTPQRLLTDLGALADHVSRRHRRSRPRARLKRYCPPRGRRHAAAHRRGKSRITTPPGSGSRR